MIHYGAVLLLHGRIAVGGAERVAVGTVGEFLIRHRRDVAGVRLEAVEELYSDKNKISGELPQTRQPFYNGSQELSSHSNEFEGRFPVHGWKRPFD